MKCRSRFPVFALVHSSDAFLSSVSLSPAHERKTLINYIENERRHRNGTFSVIDIGAMGNPWSVSAGIIDAIADLFATNHVDCWSGWERAVSEACCRSTPSTSHSCFDESYTRTRCCRNGFPQNKLVLFPVDITSPDGWEMLHAYVRQNGRFDFAICSHVLEDIIDPRVVIKALARVAEAGFFAVPSKFDEFEVGRERNYGAGAISGKYRGSIHHRWIYTVKNGQLLATPKLPVLDSDDIYDQISRVGDRSIAELNFFWHHDIPFQVLNGGYLGPTIEAVIDMMRAALGPNSNDDVDALLFAQRISSN